MTCNSGPRRSTSSIRAAGAISAVFVAAAVFTAAAASCRSTGGASASGSGRTVTLAAVGDVLLARGVGRWMERRGVHHPFARTRHIIQRADIAFCNLECPLSLRGFPRRARFLFRADPSLAGALGGAGFDVVSLANNHTLDYGRDALIDTIRSVSAAGMTPVGAGLDLQDALRPVFVTVKGLKVGFMAQTDIQPAGAVPLSDRPGVAGVDLLSIPSQIKRAKAGCDLLVVSFHWGIEYMKGPTQRQQRLARLAIDNGADLVLGHHPHVLQPVETYKGRPIVYSMGGFVWDSRVFGSNRSAVYIFRLEPSKASLIEVIPVLVRHGQPVPSRDAEQLNTRRAVRHSRRRTSHTPYSQRQPDWALQ